MEFEPIETQEDFDRAIKARLERERTKVREQYADYDSLKEKAGRLEEAEKKIGELEDAAAKRNAADELQKVREKVSRETGVSPEIVGMLGGTDEESLMASAKAISEAYRTPTAPVLGETGMKPASKGSADEKLEFVNQLLGQK